MPRVSYLLVSYFSFELFLYFFFSLLNAFYLPKSEGYVDYAGINFRSAFKIDLKRFSADNLKGIIERFFLILGIHHNLGQVIIAFSAIKLGTRINNNSKQVCKVTQDYFIIGNLCSVIFSIFYSKYLLA